MIYAQRIPVYKPSNYLLPSLISFIDLIRYESVNTQRNRDKQRLVELEKSLNEEKQSRQKLELQMKTEKTLTKKLQDDLTKLSSTPPR